jgi:hypothetical protein
LSGSPMWVTVEKHRFGKHHRPAGYGGVVGVSACGC